MFDTHGLRGREVGLFLDKTREQRHIPIDILLNDSICIVQYIHSRFIVRVRVGFGLSWDFFLANVVLHLHCLLFGVLGWVSVQHFEISADVRRAI